MVQLIVILWITDVNSCQFSTGLLDLQLQHL